MKKQEEEEEERGEKTATSQYLIHHIHQLSKLHYENHINSENLASNGIGSIHYYKPNNNKK